MSTPTTARRVPVLGDNGRFDDEYTPQAVLDAVTQADGARAAAVTAKGKAEEAQAKAEQKAKEIADAKGQANGVASLDGAAKVPASQMPDGVFAPKSVQTTVESGRLSPEQLSGTFVAVRTSDNKALPAGTIVVITLDKTLAQVTASPVADIADITFQTGA